MLNVLVYVSAPMLDPPCICAFLVNLGLDVFQHLTSNVQHLKWWRELDSNQRRQSRQIYSLIPLATREPLQLELVIGIEPTTY